MLRAATNEDLEMIAGIAESAFGQHNPLPRNLIAQQLSAGRVSYLIDGSGAAFISFSQVLDEIEIYDLAVVKGRQGQGIGQVLFNTFLQEYADNHFFLEVAEGNLAARHIYEKMGFQQYHERSNYYQDGQTAILMEKKP
ncbi:GNAT family N-acetyltransferase [Fructobacillus durionis]|uniref:Ribosomal-protein-alanine N-acetyltransferase n=1 Tax=Fructobacillus durionis TaxID=283737 RepID=A0A1I1GDP2_9LACO|nr:GNAT family N-acetyltransferase [Fructobacillus durionis]SFC09402.1 ribosomal-protein-alanine N-acetyltransferase [Fructobacillus durionis]